MSFDDVRSITIHFGQQPRKSKEVMVAQIVYKVGQDLQTLVSAASPLSLKQWNEIAVGIGGSPRKSFADVGEEFEASLDPAFDDFDGDIPIIELRDKNSDLRLLARKLGIDKVELTERISKVHGGTLLARFVADVRAKQNPLSHGTVAVSGLVRIASTRVNAQSVEKLSEKWMIDQSSGADSICIAAGFYDVEFLRNLLKKHSAAQSVRLLFNGLGGYRLHTQRDELIALRQELKNDKRMFEIRLAFAPGMFHSKLFLITKSGSTTALVGSANATTAAFARNEEILISLPEAGALVNYFESAWTTARTLDKLNVTAKSLVAFFRTGILYFKPVTTLAITLNPFTELLNTLTAGEKKVLGGVDLRHSELGTGVGPFNLKLAILGDADADLESPESLERGEDPATGTARVSIRPWSVETCFGYWVPSVLDDVWRENRDAASARKQQRWESFRDALTKTPDTTRLEKYQEYLDGFSDKLKALPNSKELLAKLDRDPFDLSIFEKFVERVDIFLKDDQRLARLSLPFASGVMPEIWDDAGAYADFSESFSDHLSLISRKTPKPLVPKIILEKLKGYNFQNSEELLDAFESYLEEHGWTDDDWALALK